MLFINKHGKLCYEVRLFNKPIFTMIDVSPQFDGYDVNGNIINIHDWSFIN